MRRLARRRRICTGCRFGTAGGRSRATWRLARFRIDWSARFRRIRRTRPATDRRFRLREFVILSDRRSFA